MVAVTTLHRSVTVIRDFCLLLLVMWHVSVEGCPPPPPPILPPPPPARPTFTYCPSNILQLASPGLTSAQVAWSQPTATGVPNYATRVEQINGPVNGSTFSEAQTTTTITYQSYQDGCPDMAYCTFTVKVQVKRCSPLANIYQGKVTCTASNLYGSTCIYTCNSGYSLDVEDALTCQIHRQWNKSLPTCRPVSCGSPTLPASQNATCLRGHVYPESCTISCNVQGYRLNQSPLITCQADRTWSATPPCQDYEAPAFPNGCVANYNVYSAPRESPVALDGWPDPDVTDNSEKQVTLAYNPPKGTVRGLGYHVINVTATDTSGNNATCFFAAIVIARMCPPLTSPANGRVNCTYRYSEGSACTVTCNRTYEPKGQSTVTCLRSRYWDAPLPTCQLLTCATPSPPTYGSLQCTSGYGYGAVCWLLCPTGFKTPSLNTVRCQDDKSWTAAGICVDIEKPQFTNGCPLNVETYSSPSGQPNHLTWKPPDVTDNSGLDVKLVSSVTAANYSFPVGVTTVTYTATDMAGNSNNCSFTVTLKASVCPVPDFGRHMVYGCPDGYALGARCGLSCTDGISLIGPNTTVCRQNDSTVPPRIYWSWDGPETVPPICANASCPELSPPSNGALACLLGQYGWDCLLNCKSGYDLPRDSRLVNDGHLQCTKRDGTWTNTVSTCNIKTTRNKYPQKMSNLAYYSGSCDVSSDFIKSTFITRMTTNDIINVACINVPTCIADNVKVTCWAANSGRKRKSAYATEPHVNHTREKRVANFHYQTGVDTVLTYDNKSTFEKISQQQQPP